jgi:chromosome partitioning protein
MKGDHEDMKTIAIANFKGGVGKTATAVNLAALLAREGRPTLLIDADPQHNATDFFLPEFEGITLTDVLTGEGETVWEDNVSATDYSFLAMLPADMRLLTLDLRAFLGGGSDGMDKRLFDFLALPKYDKTYDFCLIDCPPSFTAASVAALVCADEVILPVKADAFSRAGALEMIAQVQSLARWHVAPRFRVLVTMADRTRLSRQVEAQLRDSGLDVFETVIPASVCVGEASFARQPLYAYAPTSKAAQGYEALLKEVLGDG